MQDSNGTLSARTGTNGLSARVAGLGAHGGVWCGPDGTKWLSERAVGPLLGSTAWQRTVARALAAARPAAAGLGRRARRAHAALARVPAARRGDALARRACSCWALRCCAQAPSPTASSRIDFADYHAAAQRIVATGLAVRAGDARWAGRRAGPGPLSLSAAVRAGSGAAGSAAAVGGSRDLAGDPGRRDARGAVDRNGPRRCAALARAFPLVRRRCDVLHARLRHALEGQRERDPWRCR